MQEMRKVKNLRHHQHSPVAVLPTSTLMGLGTPRLGQAGVCAYGCNLQGASEVKLL